MYVDYWKLKEKPFRNTPDPKFLYHSAQHEEALARMRYVVNEGMGCMVMSGVFGCGKTLLLNTLTKNLSDKQFHIAKINNPQLDPSGLLHSFLYQMGVKDKIPSKKSGMLNKLDEVIEDIYNDGKHILLIVDEAHVIGEVDVFDELRMLLNWQKDDKYLLTLILSGQPELLQSVSNIKQLAQRVGIRAELDRFQLDDTIEYINHRLKIAGSEDPIFSDRAYQEIFDNSGGIPRRINAICDLSLLTGFIRKKNFIGEDLVKDTIGDLI
ncbi:MAG: ExeA family protein [Elusimicrobiota bacterium]